jgi:hypothetical protein
MPDRVYKLASGLLAACPEITAEHAINLALWIIEHLRGVEAYEESARN